MQIQPLLPMVGAATLVVVLISQAIGDEVRYDELDGVKYRITRQVTQQAVPTTVMKERKQTQYVQQVTTESVDHQQVYSVPVTQYQMTPYLVGRWNPFVTPYWTYRYEPVTHWQQQVATVQVPVSRVAWIPQETTVQVPVVEYRMAEREVTIREPVNQTPTVATAQPLSSHQSTAANTSRPHVAANPATTGSASGGVALESDPPPQATGWQTPGTAGSRYR